MDATYAAALASLYATPGDLSFAATRQVPPTLRDLVDSMLCALTHGDSDTAEAMSYEVARIIRADNDEARDNLLRCTSGLWRLH